jgi:hypothetical protein
LYAPQRSQEEITKAQGPEQASDRVQAPLAHPEAVTVSGIAD